MLNENSVLLYKFQRLLESNLCRVDKIYLTKNQLIELQTSSSAEYIPGRSSATRFFMFGVECVYDESLNNMPCRICKTTLEHHDLPGPPEHLFFIPMDNLDYCSWVQERKIDV